MKISLDKKAKILQKVADAMIAALLVSVLVFALFAASAQSNERAQLKANHIVYKEASLYLTNKHDDTQILKTKDDGELWEVSGLKLADNTEYLIEFDTLGTKETEDDEIINVYALMGES